MRSRFRLPRPALLPALLAGAVLATGLSTLAGGGRAGDAAVRPAVAIRQAAAGTADEALAPATAPGGPARPRSAAGGAQASAPAEPPPFAPGGDDLLPVSASNEAFASTVATPAAPRAQAAAAAAQSLPSAPPSLQLWLDRNPLPAGETAGLYLAADGTADSDCRGLGLLQGRRLTNGRHSIGPATPGRHRVGVRCGGLQRELLLVVPWPVLADPALNRLQIAFDLDAQPGLRALGLAETAPEAEVQTAADFFQDGRQSRFVTAADVPVHWLAVDDQGRWTDRSAELQPEPAQRQGCARPRQALVADLNGDNRPDVWLVCEGEAALVFVSGSSPEGGRYRRLRGGSDGAPGAYGR